MSYEDYQLCFNPCLTEEPDLVECDECNGAGYIYYDENDDKIGWDEYRRLPVDKRHMDLCYECNLVGQVINEYNYEEF